MDVEEKSDAWRESDMEAREMDVKMCNTIFLIVWIFFLFNQQKLYHYVIFYLRSCDRSFWLNKDMKRLLY